MPIIAIIIVLISMATIGIVPTAGLIIIIVGVLALLGATAE